MAKMTVLSEKCKGCGLCVTACPKNIVALQKEKRNKKGYFFAVCTDEFCLHRLRNVRNYVPGLRYNC